MEAYGVIYKTTNLINSKTYVGQSIRKGRELEKYIGSGLLLWKAIDKYGIENFEKEILCECSNKEQLNRMEKLYIKLLCPDYNIAEGGNGGNTYYNKSEEEIQSMARKVSDSYWSRSEEERQKIKDKLSNKLSGENNPNYGKKVSDETRKRMSEKRRQYLAENGHPCKGAKRNKEASKKAGETLKRKSIEEKSNIKEKVSNSWKNRTEEQKQASREKRKATWNSKDQNEKDRLSEERSKKYEGKNNPNYGGKTSKAIVAINIKNGNKSKFVSIGEASRELGIPVHTISRIVNNKKIHKETDGYTFVYADKI